MLRLIAITLLITIVQSCAIADLRTADIKNDQQPAFLQEKAENLLQAAITKQGLDQTNSFSSYEIIGHDHWKGLLGKIGNLWDWQQEKIAIRFTIGDFDGQVEVLEGKKKGFVAGIQSWDYYEMIDGQYNTEVKDDKRIIFGLAAYHYYYELATRLAEAPFIRYVGTDEIDGRLMDKILVSWGNERTKDYDQYVLWIGQKSSLIEATTHTVRDSYLPMSGFLYSTARFDDYREIDGVLIPFKQTVQLKNPKDSTEKYLHQFNVESFRWNAVEAQQLRPNSSLKKVGDTKVSE